MSEWRRSRSSYGPDLKLFKARFDWMINPRNGHEEKMIVLEGGDSVQVVAETNEGEILLVKQYRFGTAEYMYELPGGLIDAGEEPQEAVKRELVEETGYTARSWHKLGDNPANPVFMSAHIHHFAAKGIRADGVSVLDDGEDIHVEKIKKETVRQWLLEGKFRHPHTVCALLAFFAKEWI